MILHPTNENVTGLGIVGFLDKLEQPRTNGESGERGPRTPSLVSTAEPHGSFRHQAAAVP
ncbi:MAG TPA: hypothetical protein VHX19_07780 [Stellaceae bacterium]|nr:hypothetical protein [Stellaceae bacterium]